MDHHARDPFHLAIPVTNLDQARHFYGTVLGCPEGRSSAKWIDFDLFGHQLVVHEVPSMHGTGSTNPVDGDEVPVPHFGVVLTMDAFRSFAERLKETGVPFVIPPRIRFAGLPGEQATMFFRDPSGNCLEFKAFADRGKLFAK